MTRETAYRLERKLQSESLSPPFILSSFILWRRKETATARVERKKRLEREDIRQKKKKKGERKREEKKGRVETKKKKERKCAWCAEVSHWK